MDRFDARVLITQGMDAAIAAVVARGVGFMQTSGVAQSNHQVHSYSHAKLQPIFAAKLLLLL